eukprot:gene3919-7130_t
MVTSKQKRKVKTVKTGTGSRKPYVKRACSNCKSAHTACDSNRPCQRCTSLGLEDSCVDAERKKPILRKPRKKKLKEEEIENFPSLKEYAPYLPKNSPTTSVVLGQFPTTTLFPPKPKNIPNYYAQGNNYNFEFNPNNFTAFQQQHQQGYQSPYQISNLQQPLNNENLISKNNLQQYQQYQNQNQNQPYVSGLLKNQKEEENILQEQNQQGDDDNDENVDLYMDLSNLSPLLTNTPYQNDLLTIPNGESGDDQEVSFEDDFSSQQNLQQNQNIKSTQSSAFAKPVPIQPLPLVPFTGKGSGDSKKGTLTNNQLEDLLKMVWQKQQVQSEEMKEIKKVVNDLKNLMISNNNSQQNSPQQKNMQPPIHQQQQQPSMQQNQQTMQQPQQNIPQTIPQPLEQKFQFPESTFQSQEEENDDFDPGNYSPINPEDLSSW